MKSAPSRMSPAKTASLHPIQQAFKECHALQCGFCTPGMVMNILGRFEESEALDFRKMAFARCFPVIFAAAPGTSTSLRQFGGPPNCWAGSGAVQMSTRTFGARVERNIDPKLLRGEGAFVDDIPLTNTLHGAFLRSPVARARINKIDVSAAKSYPGVAAVYTWDRYRPARYDDAAAHSASVDEEPEDPARPGARRRLLCRADHRHCRRG